MLAHGFSLTVPLPTHGVTSNKRYKDGADYHVRSIVDVVSRGGIFLLSLTPKGDGSIPPEEREIMKNIGGWMKLNGEGYLRQSTLENSRRRPNYYARSQAE